MNGDEHNPPRKRARLSVENFSDQLRQQNADQEQDETTIQSSSESTANDYVSLFQSFLASQEQQISSSTCNNTMNIESTREEMIPTLLTEDSNTDDEDLQQLGMAMYEGTIGLEVSSNDLSYEEIQPLLFHWSRENKEMVFDKVFRMMKRNPQGKQVIQRLVLAEDESGLTLLMIAVKNDNIRLCRTLILEGANVNQCNDKRPYALMLAAQKGFVETSHFLLENGSNEESKSMALIPAAHFGHLEVVQLLMQYGANQNYANKKGTTPLMRAAQEGRDSVVDYLVKKGAIASAANNEGMTALMLAAQRGHAGIATALIKSGSDVNTQTRQGSTALLLAAKRGHTAAVEALLTAGADIFLTDDRHKTAAETAHRRGHIDLFLKITVMNQLHLMREGLRRERFSEIMRLSHLFVLSRAQLIDSPHRKKMHSLLEKTMKLPRPLLQNIALFLPLCPVWDRQLRYLMYETTSHHSSRVVLNGIRIIDEMLQNAALEVRSTLHHIRHLHGYSRSIGHLTLFRDCADFRKIFINDISLPFNDSIISRLGPMADLQGVLSSWGVGTAVSYGPEVAQDVVSLLEDLLGWNIARKLMERRI